MSKQVILIVIIISAMMISCTGCENEIGETLDLSHNSETLTSFQWVKELTPDDSEYLTFSATPFGDPANLLFSLEVYEDEEQEGDQLMGMVDMSDEEVVEALIDGSAYTLRITSTSEGVITLTLTDSENNALYFAATPLPQ